MNHQLDTVQLRRRYRQTLASYPQHAIVQDEITQRALERLDYIKYTPKRILDLSLHPALSQSLLTKRFSQASYIPTAMDLSGIKTLKKRFFQKPKGVCLWYEALPFADNSVDFIFMSLSLLWVNNGEQLLRECYRVLQPGGMLLFTTLGPDTLKELRAACEVSGVYPRVHDFIDMHNIGDALIEMGYDNPVMDLEHIELQYKTFFQLLSDIKMTACANLNAQRCKGFMTPHSLSQIEKNYSAQTEHNFNATYEFVYGHAWVGQHKRQRIDKKTGEVSIPLSQLKSS